jgi:hypothetical protein
MDASKVGLPEIAPAEIDSLDLKPPKIHAAKIAIRKIRFDTNGTSLRQKSL